LPALARRQPASRSFARLGIEIPQEVTDSVRLVLGHQRRAVAGEAVADRLELGEAVVRRKPDAAVGQRVRPEDTDGDSSRRNVAGVAGPAAMFESGRRVEAADGRG
jgi:hypothetical protein